MPWGRLSHFQVIFSLDFISQLNHFDWHLPNWRFIFFQPRFSTHRISCLHHASAASIFLSILIARSLTHEAFVTFYAHLGATLSFAFFLLHIIARAPISLLQLTNLFLIKPESFGVFLLGINLIASFSLANASFLVLSFLRYVSSPILFFLRYVSFLVLFFLPQLLMLILAVFEASDVFPLGPALIVFSSLPSASWSFIFSPQWFSSQLLIFHPQLPAPAAQAIEQALTSHSEIIQLFDGAPLCVFSDVLLAQLLFSIYRCLFQHLLSHSQLCDHPLLF